MNKTEKVCTMNCSPGPGNNKTREQRMSECEDCMVVKAHPAPDTAALQARIAELEDALNEVCSPESVNAYADALDEIGILKARIVELEAELKKINNVSSCGTVDSFLSLPDQDKRYWFALAIEESAWRKDLQSKVEALESMVAAQAGQEPSAIIVRYPDRTEELHWEEGCVDPDYAETRGDPVIINLYKRPPAPASLSLVQATLEAAVAAVGNVESDCDASAYAIGQAVEAIRALDKQAIIDGVSK